MYAQDPPSRIQTIRKLSHLNTRWSGTGHSHVSAQYTLDLITTSIE